MALVDANTWISRRLLPLLLLGAAAFYLWTTLCAMFNFGFVQPMFDEYVNYATYLEMPFPDSVLQPGNGHRPIFPGLFIVAEIKWFAANHALQFAAGTIFALVTALLLAWAAWRETGLPIVARAAGVLLAILGVFWLANARMLLHSYELLHVYLLSASVVVAAWCTYLSKQRNSPLWLIVACAACAVAMFSFGPGAASFIACLVLGVLLRLPWRWLLIPIAGFAFCLVLYLFVLPGDQGVRGLLVLQPLENLRVAAQWLSSPWIEGWLGLGDPPLGAIMVDTSSWYGHALRASANAVAQASGIGWRGLSTILGGVGIFAFCARLLMALVARQPPSRLQVLAFAIGMFALASAAIISIARFDFFRTHPEEIHADRYLVWSSLFWASLCLSLLGDVARSRSGIVRTVCLAFVLLLPFVLFPTHETGVGWAAIVYRNSQQFAAAARSDVLNDDLVSDDDAASRSAILHTLDLLRAQHLAMFASPMPAQVSATPQRNAQRKVQTQWRESFISGSGVPAAHFDGWITTGLGGLQRDAQLIVLDDGGHVVGFAEYSFVKPNAPSLRLGMPRKRGFDGYVKGFDPAKTYTLIARDARTGRDSLLAVLAPKIDPATAAHD